MRFVSLKRRKYTKQFSNTGDVGTRDPEGVRFQINGRVVVEPFRFVSIVLVAALILRPLVNISYAADSVKVPLSASGSSTPLQSTSASKSGQANCKIENLKDALIDAFGTNTEVTITVDSATVTKLSQTNCTWTLKQPTKGYLYTTVSGKSTPYAFTIGQPFTFPFEGGTTYITFTDCGNVVAVPFTSESNRARYTWSVQAVYSYVKPPLSDNEALNEIVDQNNKFHQEEVDKGEQSSSDAAGMVQDLQTQVKSKWEILFYPIEFTKKFLALFSSSAEGATMIEFPSFSLEVDGSTYQVWNSYTFDMGMLKSNFGVLFTGLHMVVGVIEVNFFIRYLYRKYDEVFGNGGGD